MKTLPGLLTILIVDDEEQILVSCDTILRMAGYPQVVTCQDGGQALPLMEAHPVGLVLLDLNLAGHSGQDLLEAITGEYPHVPVVVITGDNTVQIAVACMRSGAFDYVVKPLDKAQLLKVVRQALAFATLRNEHAALRSSILARALSQPEAFASMVSFNSEMLALFCYMEVVAGTSQPILITGETGVGKELLARAVHDVSGRKGRLVAVNVSGLDESMFSDTLFGHRKGAYTGATEKRPGMVEQAEGGTLFLDEIGDLAPGAQVKLLRLLQEQEYLPLGMDAPKLSSARIVLATHQDLRALQDSGAFRRDLYYRIISHHVHIPPLRDRMDEIPLLVDRFLDEAALQFSVAKPGMPPALIPLLFSYGFPGNIRELRAMVFDAVAHMRSEKLSLAPFKEHIQQHTLGGHGARMAPQSRDRALTFGVVLPTINEAKGLLIEEALLRSAGNKSQAAEMLGMTRQALNLRQRRAPAP